MSLIWTFQQDNNPKHTNKLATPTFSQKQIDVMPCPAQSPDLNPTENLSRDISVLLSKIPDFLAAALASCAGGMGSEFPQTLQGLGGLHAT